MDELWGAFFNRSYEIGEWALAQGLLDREDIREREAFLFLGLPGLCVLEVLLQSLQVEDGFVLSSGVIITSGSCPPEGMQFLAALGHAKGLLQQVAPLSEVDKDVLRRTVLYANDPDKHPGEGSPEKAVTLNRVSGSVQGVATQISQLPSFKGNFDNVLALLGDSR